ncbi:MAG: hypothetical protein WC627_13330, partial [Legionella sp.]
MDSRIQNSKKSKAQEKGPFSITNVVYSPGVDRYLNDGNTVNQLIIEPIKRDAFFKEHPDLLNLLKRKEVNPLVHESEEINSVNGEFFITPEATALLIERMFRQEKNRKIADGQQFNTKNIFIIDNNAELFKSILTELIIKNNEDAKFILINEIHASLLYMRNIDNSMHCFFLDSEPGTYNRFVKELHTIYPTAIRTQSNFTLLKDYYSCFTFVLKSLKYFVKHGHEFFPLIEKQLSPEMHQNETLYPNINLELEDLPAPLLKLYQGSNKFTDEVLNTVVSVKKKQTLKDYYQEYAVAVKDKHDYNSAALLKKYHYLDILAQYMEICRTETYTIATEKVEDLPINLHNRILKFSEVPKIQVEGTTAHPVDTYLMIKEILDSQKEVLTPYEQSLIKPIEEKFPDFKNIYFKNKKTYPTDSDAHTNTNTLLVIAALAEIHDLAHIEQYLEFAQTLMGLFGSYAYVLDYFKKHAHTDSKQPIHDLCLFELSDESLSSREYWIELALQFGPEATKYLANAEKINPFLQQDAYSLQQLGLSSELDRVARIAANISYSRSKEHPQLAALCLRFNASSEAFEKSLNIIQKRLKSFDYLPDITIHGADFDSKLSQYTFSKLPVGDLDGFFLGEYTSCCQSMGKQAETAVTHGMTSPYSGFYVVRRANKIIAQSWVWIADNGDVVFDSWEFIN